MKTIISFAILCVVGVKSNGQYWEPLGGGLTGEYGNDVQALYADTIHDLLWMGGTFDTLGDIVANNLAVWDGSQWVQLNKEPEPVSALTMKGDTLIYATGLATNYELGMYVDTTFVGTLGNLFAPNCLYVYHDTILAGGEFTGGIKYWNGSEWKIFNGGVDGFLYQVHAIGEYNGELIVGGKFSEAGGIAANNIATWNGSEWHSLGDGITSDNSYVYAAQEYKDELYVGGDFEEAGEIFTGDIAKWNGVVWDTVNLSSLGSSCGAVLDFYTADSLLYVTGEIVGGSCLGSRAAIFDGTNWFDLYLNNEGRGQAVSEFNNEVIVATNFVTNYLGDTINYIGHFLGYPSNTHEPAKETPTALLLYPNPASNSVSFILKGWSSNETVSGTVILRDLHGTKKIEEQIVLANEVSYSLPLPPGLPDGIYLLEVSEGKRRVSGSFIKQH